MFPYHNFFGIAAPVLSFIAFLPYVISIIKGKTKPSDASWWAWTALTFVVVVSSWAGGAPWQVLLLPLWLCISQLLVALLAIKYGDHAWDIKNKLFVASAGGSVLLWVITGNPLIALGFTVVADLFASLPNFRHVATNPLQENKLAWVLGWGSAVFALLAVKEWTFASSAWAIYFFINMTIVLFFLYRKRIIK